ncbi:MAG: cysteine hydrolase [Acetobacteraceae bacterium]
MQDGEGIRFGRLGARTAHLCIDMQAVFAEATEWQVPWMRTVLPVVRQIAERHPAETIFTRFIPPAEPDAMPGTWQRYWRRWAHMTRHRLDPALLDLPAPLRALVPPASVVDKCHYSPFLEPGLPHLLRERRIDTLVVSGGETDICVLATVLGAVDRGLRVVLATDALCSTSDQAHDCLVALYRDRFSQQIEAAGSDEILANWG